MNKIAIIGANSYIARNFIYYLKRNATDVRLDLYDIGKYHLDEQEGYQQLNILNRQELEKVDYACNAVFLFTGKTGNMNSFQDYEEFVNINELSLLNVIREYQKQHSEAKIIFPSTRLVYKGKEETLQETAEKEFLTVYAMNKYSCEQYLEMYRRMYGIKYCILRICVPYGTMILGASSYGTADFMMRKAKNQEDIILYGDGSQRRTITHIQDLCQILYWSAQSEECLNDIFNVGGEDYSLYEMAEKIADVYGVGVRCQEWPIEAEKIESGSTVFDSSKLDQKMGKQSVHYEGRFKQWIGEQ